MSCRVDQPFAGRLSIGAAVLALSLLVPVSASGQALRDHRDAAYWVTHGSLSGWMLLGAWATGYLQAEPHPFVVESVGDASVRGRRQPAVAKVSSGLLFTGLLGVWPAMLALAPAGKNVNAAVIALEVQSANLALTRLVKALVRRPRPLAYDATTPDVDPDCTRQSRGGCRSFYSGHASASFSAAMAHATLFSEGAGASRSANAVVWGAQFAVAGAAAHLRVRAGEHFYSDALTGMLIGGALGYVGPVWVHGARSPRLEEGLAALGGTGVGFLAGFLAPTESALRAGHARLGPSWALCPSVGGLMVSGRF